MRARQKSNASSITRRDPVPRYGATLDIFHALDANDLASILENLAPDVVGSIRLPDESAITFASRDEYIATIGVITEGLRAAGVRSRTKVTNYHATSDGTMVLVSIDLDRIYDVHSTHAHLRGHATIVWAIGSEGMKIVQWRITWERVREQSGDWSG
jgi:hypothetical protein